MRVLLPNWARMGASTARHRNVQGPGGWQSKTSRRDPPSGIELFSLTAISMRLTAGRPALRRPCRRMKAARVAAALVCALLSTTMVAASAAAPTATAAATAPTPEARLKWVEAGGGAAAAATAAPAQAARAPLKSPNPKSQSSPHPQDADGILHVPLQRVGRHARLPLLGARRLPARRRRLRRQLSRDAPGGPRHAGRHRRRCAALRCAAPPLRQLPPPPLLPWLPALGPASASLVPAGALPGMQLRGSAASPSTQPHRPPLPPAADDAPFTGWQEGRTVFGAVLFPNTTRTDARAAAQAICAHVPSRLPSLLGTRLGARATAAPVGTGIVTAVHDPRKGHPKREWSAPTVALAAGSRVLLLCRPHACLRPILSSAP